MKDSKDVTSDLLSTRISDRLSGHSIEAKSELKVMKDMTNISVLMNEQTQKSRAEDLAWTGLLSRLVPKSLMCRGCKGEGYRDNGEACLTCSGTGSVERESDIRAIEMVLGPKFPKVQLTVSATLSDATTEDILEMIDNL